LTGKVLVAVYRIGDDDGWDGDDFDANARVSYNNNRLPSPFFIVSYGSDLEDVII
jgi:hypothetical protein